MPIQQMLLGAGGAAKKTYLDDIFSTYLWIGNATARSINTGVDMTKGGMVWFKDRDDVSYPMLFDTERGVTKGLVSSETDAESTESQGLTAFNNNGFSIGTGDRYNKNNDDIASWTFRKAPGFFDVVTWTGDGNTPRAISHSLGCIPGMIVVKNRDSTENWAVYHRSIGATKYLRLDLNSAASTSATLWADTEPTSTNFTVSNSARVNGNGDTYVAYLFAGGESTASGARSVSFDGNDDLTIASDSDFNYGTGDFTWEFWVKLASSPGTEYLIDHSDSNNGGTLHYHGDQLRYLNPTTGTSSPLYTDGGALTAGIWHHVAVVRNSGTTTIYVDGSKRTSASDSHNYPDNKLWIARRPDGQYLTGSISNFRIVKGTAVYTSSFKPPTEPLTNITNTVLLCCQNSQASYATVSPSSITAGGDPTVSDSISPFDDPAAFTFGENGDQGIIKCGSFKADSSANANIELGFEPQWVLTKRTDSTGHWNVWDTMRGWTTTGVIDVVQRVNENTVEAETSDYGGPHSNGFESNGTMGYSGEGIYVAIRRPDGYVGKPVEAGTNVFAMDTGLSKRPNFDSAFPVDFALARIYASSGDWYAAARLIQGKSLIANSNSSQGSQASFVFDDNEGWDNATWGSTAMSWMWKRHAGFDVVTYTGNGSAGRGIPHSLNKIPEMIWVKYRSSDTYGWVVYHKGLNGGSSPEGYYIRLDTTGAEGTGSSMWNDTAPTSTVFTVGTNAGTNSNTADYIAMLFTSVDGISKCGYYSGSVFEQTITTGFQPRFVIIRQTDEANWTVLDTTRGWSSGSNDEYLLLNDDSGETGTADMGHPTSTGFQVSAASENSGLTNQNGFNYIYYAHA